MDEAEAKIRAYLINSWFEIMNFYVVGTIHKIILLILTIIIIIKYTVPTNNIN